MVNPTTFVIEHDEIISIIDDLESVVVDSDLLHNSIFLIDNDDVQDDINNLSMEILDINQGLDSAVSSLKEIRDRFSTVTPEGQQSLFPDDRSQNDKTFSVTESKNAILSALNSFEAVKGHDQTESKYDNKEEIPISASDIETIKSVLKSSLSLHNTNVPNSYITNALAELKNFLQQTYERFKVMASNIVAAGVIYVIADAILNVVKMLDLMIKNSNGIMI